MIADELKYRIRAALRHQPTAEQQEAIDVFARFMTDRSERVVMVLRGAAGTGKTTLASAVVQAMRSLRQKLVLMAPTGRAAKVFARSAVTIHRRIYRQKTAADLATASPFSLNANLQRDTLFIIDEASMIANQGLGDTAFGSGRLLDDLIEYVYGPQGNCRLLLIGDSAQLPPVGEVASPALQRDVLSSYALNVYEASLNEVLRQAQSSGILYNATLVRRLAEGQLPRFLLRGFSDVSVVPGDELIESLATSYSRAGMDETIVITRSNKRANIYNLGIRRTVLDREEELCRGDQLMVVKNNYYWLKAEGGAFIANGDVATVVRVRNVHEQHGFRFAEVTLQFPDYEQPVAASSGDQSVPLELTCTVLLDTLTSESPSLTREQQQRLYESVMADYADIPLKGDRIKQMRQDRYYNALQVKFAYAVTCHKAQGGQWAHVYLDQGYMTDDMLTPDYAHWLYTAVTRATERLFLVNWPPTQVEAQVEQP